MYKAEISTLRWNDLYQRRRRAERYPCSIVRVECERQCWKDSRLIRTVCSDPTGKDLKVPLDGMPNFETGASERKDAPGRDVLARFEKLGFDRVAFGVPLFSRVWPLMRTLAMA